MPLEVNETQEKLEIMKSKLNPLLEEYFKERKAKDVTNTKKDAFFDAFKTFSPEQKRAYRDYVYQMIKGEKNENNPLTDTIKELSSMDKLEVYAGICNNCKEDLTFELPTPPASMFSNLQEKNIPTEYLGFQEPNFTVH